MRPIFWTGSSAVGSTEGPAAGPGPRSLTAPLLRGTLLEAYFAAGVREYWLVDARGKELSFQILSSGEAGVGQSTRGFTPVTADAEGWRFSAVLGAGYQLERTAGPGGFWEYELRESVPGQ